MIKFLGFQQDELGTIHLVLEVNDDEPEGLQKFAKTPNDIRLANLINQQAKIKKANNVSQAISQNS